MSLAPGLNAARTLLETFINYCRVDCETWRFVTRDDTVTQWLLIECDKSHVSPSSNNWFSPLRTQKSYNNKMLVMAHWDLSLCHVTIIDSSHKCFCDNSRIFPRPVTKYESRVKTECHSLTTFPRLLEYKTLSHHYTGILMEHYRNTLWNFFIKKISYTLVLSSPILYFLKKKSNP